jgi:hypothetical protein
MSFSILRSCGDPKLGRLLIGIGLGGPVVKLHFGRIFVLGAIAVGATALTISCASSEEGVFDEVGGHLDAGDASADGQSGFGGIGGSGSGFGGVGGGAGGTGGSSGTGGFAAGGTGGENTGGIGGGAGGAPNTCNPAFCPNPGVGQPCCAATGACGIDNGMGCQLQTGGDF